MEYSPFDVLCCGCICIAFASGRPYTHSLRFRFDKMVYLCCHAFRSNHNPAASQQLRGRMITAFDDPFLGVCFDTGHAHCYGDREWKRTLDILGPHIVTCHLHDNYGTFDDHNPPGGGNIDWSEMSAALKGLPRLLHAETESGDWGKDSWEKFSAMWQN